MSEVPVLAEAKKVARNYWLLALARGILLLIIGVLLLTNAAGTLTVIAWLFGALLILDGVFLLISVFAKDSTLGASDRWLRLLFAVLAIAAGLAVALWPDKTVDLIVLVLGIWAIVAGIVGAIWAFRLRGDHGSSWDGILTFSLITLALGIILLTSTEQALLTIAVILAVYAIAAGIAQLVAALSAKDVAKDIEKAVRDAVDDVRDRVDGD